MPATYAEWLRDSLRIAGRTQVELASHLGLDQSAISRSIRGERQLKPSEIRAIAAFLGVPPPPQSPEGSSSRLRLVVPLPIRSDAGNRLGSSFVPVVGYAADGIYMEESAMSAPQPRQMPIASAPDYALEDQFFVQVRSLDLMQGEIYYLCVDIEKMGREIDVGDRVYFEHRKGDLVQFSVRRVMRAPAGLVLSHIEEDTLIPGADIPFADAKVLGVAVGKLTYF